MRKQIFDEERCKCGMRIPNGYGYYNYGRAIKCRGCGRINQKKSLLNLTPYNPNIEAIGFLLEGDNIIVSNPCTIPIKFMEHAIRKAKRKKAQGNKKGIYSVGVISLKIPIPKIFRKKSKGEKKK